MLTNALNKENLEKNYLIDIYEALGDLSLYEKSYKMAEENYLNAKTIYLSCCGQ
jgi:hypothetical protein